ncbi:50S ribosomal protein L11 methyltransferase [bacterium]|nr:50S ribosomal protein L11 methyltransferase [bacterium]
MTGAAGTHSGTGPARKGLIWQSVTCQVPGDSAEFLTAGLWDLGIMGLVTDDTLNSTFNSVPPKHCLVQAYFDFSNLSDSEQTQTRQAVADLIAQLRDLFGPGEYSLAWNEIDPARISPDWRSFHTAFQAGCFYIQPPWDLTMHPELLTLTLNPAMAFGTGQHATTQLILRFLETNGPFMAKTCLDCGTGSGILGLATLKLGLTRVVAFDCDPLVQAVLHDNINLNHASSTFSAFIGTQSCLRKCLFDLILANLEWPIIQQEGPNLLSHLGPDGSCVFSGILKEQQNLIDALLARTGHSVFWMDEQDEWLALACRTK